MAEALSGVRVQYAEMDGMPSLHPEEKRFVTWQEFHEARNGLLRICRDFGTVGPVEEVRITEDLEPVFESMASVHPPEFLIPEQQLDNASRYQNIHVRQSEKLEAALVSRLQQFLATHPSWNLGVLVGRDGYVYFTGQQVWVSGNLFRDCNTLADVLARSAAR